MLLAVISVLCLTKSDALTKAANGTEQNTNISESIMKSAITTSNSSILEEITWNLDDVTTPSSTIYQFIVHIMYAEKVYTLGIMFQPRFVLAPYTKLFYYNEFDIYVVFWSNVHFQDKSLIRKIVKVQAYRNPDRECDFDLSLLEIERPFEGGNGFWNVDFMGPQKPPPGTSCTIVHFSLNYLHEVQAIVIKWNQAACYEERGYMHNCDNDTFLCLFVETPTEVDISGSPVICDNKVVGAVSGYYIHEHTALQYLPYYRDWFYHSSDNLQSSCNPKSTNTSRCLYCSKCQLSSKTSSILVFGVL
ncbi:hypothetical protein Trydic_g894 [Trypoxylus dichotomus]